MQYAKIKDNQIERIASIEALYPNTSFPSDGLAWQTPSQKSDELSNLISFGAEYSNQPISSGAP